MGSGTITRSARPILFMGMAVLIASTYFFLSMGKERGGGDPEAVEFLDIGKRVVRWMDQAQIPDASVSAVQVSNVLRSLEESLSSTSRTAKLSFVDQPVADPNDVSKFAVFDRGNGTIIVNRAKWQGASQKERYQLVALELLGLAGSENRYTEAITVGDHLVGNTDSAEPRDAAAVRREASNPCIANDGRIGTWCIMRADSIAGWPYPFNRHRSCGITDRHVIVVDFTKEELNQRTTSEVASKNLNAIMAASIAAPGVLVPKFQWTRTINYWLVLDVKDNPIAKRKLLKALYFDKDGKGPFVATEDVSPDAKLVTKFLDEQCPPLKNE